MYKATFIRNKILFLLCILYLFSCQNDVDPNSKNPNSEEEVFVKVLGIAQDAGYPQAGCMKSCCVNLWEYPEQWKKVSSIGLVDRLNNKTWIFDATPDFKVQLQALTEELAIGLSSFSGVFLTHAHIGHYTGLIHLGREVMGSKKVPVYSLPRMRQYLMTNGPWEQLTKLENIELKPLSPDTLVQLNERLSIQSLIVPHRDEYSETAGFVISGPNKKLLFIPDIDKWEKWDLDISTVISTVDYALLDGSFFEDGEIPGRDMKEIPHPFISESMDLFKDLAPSEKSKIHFIHFNHTNPVLNKRSKAYASVKKAGFNISYEDQMFGL